MSDIAYEAGREAVQADVDANVPPPMPGQPPEEIAATIAYLASDDTSYMTGAPGLT